jgi:phosphoglycerate dehydrogenase-like enzyme
MTKSPIRLLLSDGPAKRFGQIVRDSPASRDFQLTQPGDETEGALSVLAAEAEAIYCYLAPITEKVIRAAPKLRFIQKHGVSCSNIDVAAARAHGVTVATQPLMRGITVAEHALALMLACARKIIPGHLAVSGAAYRQMGLEPIATSEKEYRANWARIQGVTELYQASVGIIGMGNIGLELAKRCRAFGMTVAYHQRTRLPQQVEQSLDARYLPLDDLLATSDHVVLAVPLTPETDGLIRERTLALMKPSATIINVGRGRLVDEEALVAALRDGRIAMAGLDVYRNEPLPASSPLLGLPNVVLLPHTGGGSYRSWEVDVPACLRNVQRFFVDGKAEGIVNG